MADNDARRVIVVQADKDGYATALSINEALRQLCEMIYQQEGRRGPITMRDGLTLNAPDRFTQLQIAGTPPFSNAALVMAGTQESSLFIAKGAMMNDNGVWIATDTTAMLLEFSRTSGTPIVYFNASLSIGQAFTPTSVGVLTVSAGGAGVIFRGGGGFPNPSTGNTFVMRVPAACTVTAIYGLRVGGSGATVNVRKNGTLALRATDLSITSTSTYMPFGTLQNIPLAEGDTLEVQLVTLTGSPTYIAVQIEMVTI